MAGVWLGAVLLYAKRGYAGTAQKYSELLKALSTTRAPSTFKDPKDPKVPKDRSVSLKLQLHRRRPGGRPETMTAGKKSAGRTGPLQSRSRYGG